MPPSTEEIKLSCNEILLLIGSRNHHSVLKSLKTYISLADAIPGVSPERVVKLIGRSRIAAWLVDPVSAAAVVPDISEVTEVCLMSHTVVSLRVEDFVITPVPRRTPITFFLVRDTVVDFLHETLEVSEVHEWGVT
jgi:hypothetical protein